MKFLCVIIAVVLNTAAPPLRVAIDNLIVANQTLTTEMSGAAPPKSRAMHWDAVVAYELLRQYDHEEIFAEIEQRLAQQHLPSAERTTLLRLVTMLGRDTGELLNRDQVQLLISMIENAESNWGDPARALARIPVDEMPELATAAQAVLLKSIRRSESVRSALYAGAQLALPLAARDEEMLKQLFLNPEQVLSREFLQVIAERSYPREYLLELRAAAVGWLLTEGLIHNSKIVLADLESWTKLALSDQDMARALAAAIYGGLFAMITNDDLRGDNPLAKHELKQEERIVLLSTFSDLLDKHGGDLVNDDVVGGMMYYMYAEEPDAGNRAIMRKIIRQVFEATGPRQHQGEEVTIEQLNEILAAIEQKVVEKFAAGASD